MMIPYRELFSTVAMVLTFVAFWPYIRSIQKGETKPHVFSWVIWSITTCVVFFAQLADGGGIGAWPIGVSGAITLYIAVLAYGKRADTHLTRSDWVFLTLALASLPLWYLTSHPLSAVLVLTTVDLFGFAPTFRKSYRDPFDENLTMYWVMALRNLISIPALEHLSLTTILFPAAIAAACLAYLMMVAIQRNAVRKL